MIGGAGTDTNANHPMDSRSAADYERNESDIVNYARCPGAWISGKYSTMGTCVQ